MRQNVSPLTMKRGPQALLTALVELHFDRNDTLDREQYEEYQNIAYHEAPPVMFYLDGDGMMVDATAIPLELQPCADVSTEMMAELEAEAEGMKTARLVTQPA